MQLSINDVVVWVCSATYCSSRVNVNVDRKLPLLGRIRVDRRSRRASGVTQENEVMHTMRMDLLSSHSYISQLTPYRQS